MSAFMLSQILVGIAIVFDLLSFQFKQRQKIVACLCVAGALICSHFVLLEQWTAAGLMAIATARYLTSVFSTSKVLMGVFITSSAAVTVVTFSGVASLLSFAGSALQTTAAFCRADKKLRQMMILGTSFWLVHNYWVGSPTAVLMEVLFIGSNLVGYYRFYWRPAKSA
ncbi:MAG: YgjV family protein [Pseudomonadales bacterium]